MDTVMETATDPFVTEPRNESLPPDHEIYLEDNPRPVSALDLMGRVYTDEHGGFRDVLECWIAWEKYARALELRRDLRMGHEIARLTALNITGDGKRGGKTVDAIHAEATGRVSDTIWEAREARIEADAAYHLLIKLRGAS